MTRHDRKERPVPEPTRPGGLLEEILFSAVDQIYLVAPDGRVLLASRSGAQAFGMEPDRLAGRTWQESGLPGAVFQPLFERVRAAVALRRAVMGEYTTAGPDGERFYRYSLSPLQREENHPVGSVLCVIRDITESKREEERQARAFVHVNQVRSEWMQTLDALPELVALVDWKGRVIRANRTVQFWGLGSISHLSRRNIHDVLHPRCADPGCYLGTCLAAAARKVAHRAGTLPPAPGESECRAEAWDALLKRSIRVRIRPVPGVEDLLVVVVEDISDQRRAEEAFRAQEERLRQAQKLESVGQLAAGISHEINTPTQYVGDNLSFLRGAFADLRPLLELLPAIVEHARTGEACGDLASRLEAAIEKADLHYLLEEVPRAVAQSLEGVERVATIVKAMKAFSHPGPAEIAPFDIHQAIENTVTVARNRWKYVAEVETAFDPELSLVPCVAGEFNQVMLNLVVNAADAIAEMVRKDDSRRGRISIRTRRDGDWAEIRVADTGAGVPPEIRHRLFEPFFTTKEVGQGSGQGLSLCHSIIVRQHGGTIDFESEPGVGTTFCVRLPLLRPGEAPRRESTDRAA